MPEETNPYQAAQELQKQQQEQTVRQMQQQLEQQRIQEAAVTAKPAGIVKKAASHTMTKFIIPALLTSGTGLWFALK